ncbi:MAG: hypothetical protein ACOVNY_06860, partial [Chitinophagaceae bacterium]
MQYAKALFIDTVEITKELHNADIYAIDLVFTDYPAQQSLKDLNKRRFQLLRKTMPFIKDPYKIRWKIVRQTNGRDRASAEKLLHGFVINYRLPITELERKKEINDIKNHIPPPISKKVTVTSPVLSRDSISGVRKWKNRRIKGLFHDAKTVVHKSEFSDSIIVIATHKLQEHQLLEPFEKKYYAKKDSLYVLLDADRSTQVSVVPPKPMVIPFKDSTIIHFFKQHHLPNTLIVADVTASMTPYNAQLLHILKDSSTSEFVRFVVCFNDGDHKSLSAKIIGETGGIYAEPYKDVQQVGRLMIET